MKNYVTVTLCIGLIIVIVYIMRGHNVDVLCSQKCVLLYVVYKMLELTLSAGRLRCVLADNCTVMWDTERLSSRGVVACVKFNL